MRLDLVASEDWERAGEALRSLLQPANDETIRVHAGLEPGTLELALGLAQIYSHKRAVAVVRGNSPAFEHVLPWFQKEAYQVQTTTWSALPDAAAIKTWIESLKKETALVLAADDHPVTGALADADTLETALAEKKIFLIRVSHSAHLYRRKAPLPYSVRIGSVGDGFAYSRSGARLKTPALFSHRMAWNPADLVARFNARLAQSENQSAVEAFETTFAAQKFLPAETPRLFDRAVLSFAGVSGEALIGRVMKRMGLSSAGADIDTANLCQWDSTRLMKNWWENPPADDVARGLVAFSPEMCVRKDFASTLRATYEELVALQTW